VLRGKNKRVAEYKISMGRIVEQAKHLSVLVNDLLFIARQGAGAARLNLRTVDLGELLNKVCDDAKVIGHPKAIRVTYNVGSASELVRGDPARLRQLFLILLDNAVRYSKSQGEVKVDMEKANGEIAVRLADRGIGIAPEELESVFDRFRRGTNVMQHDGEGLGLGLPVAKAIAEAHKGRIEMASRLGEGTTVTVFLPADTTETEA
jgi:signal transduction histidine kinase